MSAFAANERVRQARLKTDPTLFSDGARAKGVLRTRRGPKAYDHVLPAGVADENIARAIRSDALGVFSRLDIQWHEGIDGLPSPNLCSSQVCAVNFLMPFARDPALTRALFSPLYPDIREVLPFEDANGPLFITFEWIGRRDYLKEARQDTTQRSRGQHFTSADAAFRYARSNGAIHTVLIEWKYTESYSRGCVAISRNGTDRREIYRHVLASVGAPIRPDVYEDVFYQPLYQLFRQQALAAAMQAAHEDDADSVSVLHIAPRDNLALRRVTSPRLAEEYKDILHAWTQLTRPRGCFRSVGVNELFARHVAEARGQLRPWANYIAKRYTPLVASDSIELPP